MQINQNNWWKNCGIDVQATLKQVWIPIGCPGYSGSRKLSRKDFLDDKFGEQCWRICHAVRGHIVSEAEALQEYEQSYRVYLQSHPEIVRLLITFCGNVYDDAVENVSDVDYYQPNLQRNHYQDIAVRRVISEFVDDPTWVNVVETPQEKCKMLDLSTGESHKLPRARGFQGNHLLQIRDEESPGYFLNPAVVPVYDPELITMNPSLCGWFLEQGCGHLSVEAFWQMSKIIEVRYDKFLDLQSGRVKPLKFID